MIISLSGCKLDDNNVRGSLGPIASPDNNTDPQPVAPPSPQGPQEVAVSWLKLFTFNTGMQDTVTNEGAQTVNIDNFTLGRPYSFYLKDTDGPVSSLSCLPSTNAFVSGSSIHMDMGVQLAPGTLALSCSATTVGNFTININYLPNRLTNITSSMIPSFLGGVVSFINHDLSADLKWLTYESKGLSYDYLSQIYVKNRDTGSAFLISTSDGTTSANSSSTNPKITADGRFIFFKSYASNLVTGSTGSQIYRKDLYNLHLPPMVVTSLNSTVSDQTGFAGNGSIYDFEISPDGRYVVFEGNPTNFVTGASGIQIYIKDIVSPELPPKIVSSLDSTQSDQTGLQGNSRSLEPHTTPDGRYVVYASEATNFVTGVTNDQIYRKDMANPSLPPVIVSSLDSSQSDQTGFEGNSGGFYKTAGPNISTDGRYVSFWTWSTNFATGASSRQIYRKDMNFLNQPPVLVSSNDSTQTNQASFQGDSSSNYPFMSADGRYIAFSSDADNFVTGIAYDEVFLKDMNSPELPPTIISSKDSTQGDQTNYASGNLNTSMQPRISSDNRYVSFESNSSTLVSGSVGKQIFIKDLTQLTVAPTREGIANSASNEQISPYIDTDVGDPSATPDGRYVVFETSANNLVPAGPTTTNRIYLKDLQSPLSPPLIVSSTDSTQADQTNYVANASSTRCTISSDGRYVTFFSQASNLVTGGSGWQIYRKDMNFPAVPPVLVSSTDSSQADQSGYKANFGAGLPHMSSNGRWVSFYSNATNLVTGGASYQIYRKDMDNPSTPPMIVSSSDSTQGDQTSYRADIASGAIASKISGDGRYVYFPSSATNFVSNANAHYQIYRKDMDNPALPPIMVSSNDSTQADQSTDQGDSPSALQDISDDGRWVVFSSASTNFVTGGGGANTQVFLKDMNNPTQPPVLVSSLDSTQADQSSYQGNNTNAEGRISNDGRYVVFYSQATNFNGGSFTGYIFMKDMNNPSTPPVLVSSTDKDQPDQTNFRMAAGDPFIAPDGSFLIFRGVGAGVMPGMGGFRQLFFYQF